MNTARISSTRSLQTICLTLLLWIAAHSLTPANADPPAESRRRIRISQAPGEGKSTMSAFVWITDGRTWSTYIEGQPTPFITGTFEAANGHWKTNDGGRPAGRRAISFY